ncbi:hypothetical protein DYE50_11380 [Treponema ruminis]|uniref:Opacity protein-like surface antigen n=1 Tax=Treponema ruminis TaxID=744515 RepID=A0A7W8LM15_9SPIR|nr:hypothetical protein [Treponema ruminis]MBB5225918.1 opacity protein-like surface antigen [Treponema ruminis]QSI03169.1 hypothetical protein DYE50_11380 [Treponema ruminis]
MAEHIFYFLDKVKRYLFIILLLPFSMIFAEEKGIVLLISENSIQYGKLTSTEQLYARSALQMFIGNLTLVDEIVVRTESNDNALREVQKKSQIEASVGLASVQSAYAIDAGAKADIIIDFSLVKFNGSWKLSYKASDIEHLTILFAKESALFSLEQIDKETDALSFSVLDSLSKRGYISPLPFNIKTQLLHEADSEENFRKYIAEYETRALDLKKQLDLLQKEALTAEERIKNESAERTLRLKIEMAERKKSVLEESERNRRSEAEELRKRQAEINELSEKQRLDFEKRLSILENRRSEILKASVRSLSLKKRIELIEADRENLKTIKKQVELSVAESNAYYDSEKRKETAAKNREGWRKADLSEGKPTDAAKEFRKAELAQIAKKWDERKLLAENEIRAGVKKVLASYEEAFARSLSELEATEFTFTSISRSENHIQLYIDEYDAQEESWTVHTKTDFSSIPLLLSPYKDMPNIQIRYTDMTGKKIPRGTDVDSYNRYRDNVEWADLYFRAAVPYLYATLSLHVQYDEKLNKYKANFTTFTITKVENSQTIYRSGKNLLRSSAQGKHFLQNQKPRKGVFLDGTFAKSFLYDWQAGSRLSAFWGDKFLFAGAGMSVFGAKYADDYSVNFEKGRLISFMALGGVSVTVFRVRPYVEMGAGYYFTTADLNDGADDVKLPSGFCASLGGGADYYITKNLTVGAFYALTYNYGCGFVDNYGLRVGINF